MTISRKVLMTRYILFLIFLVPSTVHAQTVDSGDTAWMLTATALVLFMTLPGLALFYSGLVRAKNVLSVLMQCFAIAAAASVVWMVLAYSIALTPGLSPYIGGLDRVMLNGMTLESVSGSMPESVFVMFQMTFAIITPASGFVGPAGALVIGLTAGVVCFWATQIVKRKFRIDDSLDVFPVHGIGGFLGLFLTAFFANRLGGQGFLNEEITSSGAQFVEQAIGAFSIAIWCGVVSFILFKVIDAVIGLRVDEEEETEGLDLTQHDERGYNL
jgi:ammonia channel protein AmtB